MNKKLRLTRLTVANLTRIRAGEDPVCFCPIIPTLQDEAYYHNKPPQSESCKDCFIP